MLPQWLDAPRDCKGRGGVPNPISPADSSPFSARRDRGCTAAQCAADSVLTNLVPLKESQAWTKRPHILSPAVRVP